MVYTTACERCRHSRIKCVRPSRGQVLDEVCESCTADNAGCITKRRRVGRQPGVKNRKTKALHSSSVIQTHLTETRDADHLPNPLQVLASEALGRQPSPLDDIFIPRVPEPAHHVRNSESILRHYADWIDKLLPTGRETLGTRIDELLRYKREDQGEELGDVPVFHGRTDIARPDASPEHDVISLQMLSLSDATHLFDSFMKLLTNGSMYFDPRLHTLSYVRSRSSFLLVVILAIASTYTAICSSSLLHAQLMSHAFRLESHVRNNHYKSIEIIQAFLLLASYSEIPQTLCRDKTWLYVSHATALTVELRLDAPVPYCVLTDPLYSDDNHDFLVRNAHRICLYLYIHDRNMAMVAGRFPIFPESSLTSQASLDRWGKQASAYHYDAPLCASVSLRKMVTEVHHQMATRKCSNMMLDKDLIDRSMAEWRKRWATEIQSTLEYDVIARFSAFVLTLAMMKKEQLAEGKEAEARHVCETLAFEVCCASIVNYKSWVGVLNSATFDTSMVAFCAIYTIQSINITDSDYLSDWSVLRLATLQELVSQLEQQAAARHHISSSDSMSVVTAMSRQMSRGISLVLDKKRTNHRDIQAQPFSAMPALPGAIEPVDTLDPHQSNQLDQLFSANNPFMPEWNIDSLLPDVMFPWDTNLPQQSSMDGMPIFDFS